MDFGVRGIGGVIKLFPPPTYHGDSWRNGKAGHGSCSDMFDCRLKTGHDWFERIKECLLDCVVDWGNLLILATHICVDCIVEFCTLTL